MENQQDILIEQRGAAGVITINRPAALNALNLNVLRGMWDALQSWKDDPAIKAVVLTGAGHKAFCAGGDLKHFHGAGQAYKRGEADLMHPVSFFSLEYSLNTLIYHYPKPIVALMNGITMGGGYGLAGNSSIRVACEETLFAMPETKIGFFPDVGAVSHLVKAPSHIGRYLAMTGNTLPGGDMVSAGLADYLVKKESFESILQDISAGQTDIVKIIQSYSVTISSSDQFLSLSEFCDAHFRFTDAQTILSSLGKESSEQAVGLLVELRSRSPLSVLVALAHYNRGMDDDFDTIIERDYQLCARFIQGDDLYEGIRALLIDKDKSPRWQHDSIESVPESDVDVCFVPCVPPLASVAL